MNGQSTRSGWGVWLAMLWLAMPCLAPAGVMAGEVDRPEPLTAGDHTRTLTIDDRERSYLVHVPKNFDATQPTPVVLALHGAAMNGPMMVWFSGLNETADREGFVVVYPSGTGSGPVLTWNSGGLPRAWSEGRPDDVAFIGQLLDDLETVLAVDTRRIYACGMSNGGMMCYRLAAELSERIAAIAPVAGTLTLDDCRPSRPVPVMHFHGTDDRIVRYEGASGRGGGFRFQSVNDSVQTWVKLNGCQDDPTTEVLTPEDDPMPVTRTTYGGGTNGAEVVLVRIEKGGHTWPGRKPPVGLIGKSTETISANDLMWEFFQRHRLPEPAE